MARQQHLRRAVAQCPCELCPRESLPVACGCRAAEVQQGTGHVSLPQALLGTWWWLPVHRGREAL